MKYMKTIAGLLGGGSDAKQKMMRIFNFERDIANVSYLSDIIKKNEGGTTLKLLLLLLKYLTVVAVHQ